MLRCSSAIRPAAGLTRPRQPTLSRWHPGTVALHRKPDGWMLDIDRARLSRRPSSSLQLPTQDVPHPAAKKADRPQEPKGEPQQEEQVNKVSPPQGLPLSRATPIPDDTEWYSHPSTAAGCGEAGLCSQSYRLAFDPSDLKLDPEVSSINRRSARAPPSSFNVFEIIPIEVRHDKKVWVQLIASTMPDSIYDSSKDPPKIEHPLLTFADEESRRHAVAALLFLADRYGGVDVIVYYGLKENRWDVVKWIVDTVLNSDALRPFQKRLSGKFEKCASNLPFPQSVTLKELLKHEGPTFDSAELKLEGFTEEETLDALTTESPWLTKTGDKYTHIAVGRVLQSIGVMVVRMTINETELQNVLPNVLRMIASLHHRDLIPQEVYQYQPDDPISSNSPLVPHFSSRMMAAMSDATIKESMPHLFQSNDTVMSKLIPSKFEQSPEFRPEIWLEFVLWTALYGGWPFVAARIIKYMDTHEYGKPWRLIDWHTELSTIVEEPEEEPSAVEIIKKMSRSLSSEVVMATVHSILATNFTGVGSRGIATKHMVDYLVTCKSFMDKANMALRPQTWPTVVNRILITSITTIESDPEAFLKLLKLADQVVEDRAAENTKDVAGPSSHPYHGSFSNTDPVMIFKLYHQLLGEFVYRENIQMMLLTFNQMLDFGRRASVIKHRRERIDGKRREDRIVALNPRIPNKLWIGIMKLLIDAGQYHSVHKLIYERDKHQRLLTDSSIKDPNLLVTILSFAVETCNSQLAERTQATLADHISMKNYWPGKTSPEVVSQIAISHIRNAKWAECEELLTFNKNSLRMRWDPSILIAIASSIVNLNPAGPSDQLIASTGKDYVSALKKGEEIPLVGEISNEDKYLTGGFRLYSKLISGVFGPCVVGDAYSTLESINGIVSHLSPQFGKFCRQFNSARPVLDSLDPRSGRIQKHVRLSARDMSRLVTSVSAEPRPYFLTSAEPTLELVVDRICDAVDITDTWCIRPLSIPSFSQYPSLYDPFPPSSPVQVALALGLHQDLPLLGVEAELTTTAAPAGTDGAGGSSLQNAAGIVPFAVPRVPPYLPKPVQWYGTLTPPVSHRLDRRIPLSELESRLVLEAVHKTLTGGNGNGSGGGSENAPANPAAAALPHFSKLDPAEVRAVLDLGRLPPILVPTVLESHTYDFYGRAPLSLGTVRAIFHRIVQEAYLARMTRDEVPPSPLARNGSSPSSPSSSSSSSSSPPQQQRDRTFILLDPEHEWDGVGPEPELEPEQAYTFVAAGSLQSVVAGAEKDRPDIYQLFELLQFDALLMADGDEDPDEAAAARRARMAAESTRRLHMALLWCCHRFQWLGVKDRAGLDSEIAAAWVKAVVDQSNMKR